MSGAGTNLAAYNISGNLERMFAVTMFACGGATAVIIGREIGAGRRDRVQSIAKSLMTLGLLLGLCSGALLMLTRFTILEPYVFPLFDLSPEAASTATIMLTIVAISLPMRTLGFTMGIGVLRGGGDVKVLMIIDVATLYLIFLPMASLSGLVFGLGIAIVYSSMLVEDITKTTLLFFRVKSNKWVHDVTREQVE
jgi:Na+-driven multidrug efflux pump